MPNYWIRKAQIPEKVTPLIGRMEGGKEKNVGRMVVGKGKLIMNWSLC